MFPDNFTLVWDSASISKGCFDQLELGGGKTNKTKHKTFPAQLLHKRTKFNCKVNWGVQSSSGCRQWGGSSVLINEMSLIQGEKIISTAIGQTWDMTPGSSTCQINNTTLILSSYPVKPFSCSWVLRACWLRIRNRAGTKEGAQRWGSQRAEHFENLLTDLCARRRHCRHSASLGADAGCWDASIWESSVSKPCSPTASRRECSPAASAVVLQSEIFCGCTASWETR